MRDKAKITGIIKTPSGRGHWKVKVTTENPALLLPESDQYWKYHERGDEPEYITLSAVTTNSRAIDGYDGGNVALAEECIRENEWDTDLFDYSGLNAGRED